MQIFELGRTSVHYVFSPILNPENHLQTLSTILISFEGAMLTKWSLKTHLQYKHQNLKPWRHQPKIKYHQEVLILYQS